MDTDTYIDLLCVFVLCAERCGLAKEHDFSGASSSGTIDCRYTYIRI